MNISGTSPFGLDFLSGHEKDHELNGPTLTSGKRNDSRVPACRINDRNCAFARKVPAHFAGIDGKHFSMSADVSLMSMTINKKIESPACQQGIQEFTI
jgi:hypothetical protein